MKRAWLWLLVFVVLACRALSYSLLKAETAYVFVPRSFLGGGFQTQPALLDLIVPVIVIFCLWPRYLLEGKAVRSWKPAVWDGLFLLLFPLLAGLSLFAYLARWQMFSNLTLNTLLRWLQFVSAYVACNILLDELRLRSHWQRVVIATILALSFGPLQDAYPRMGNNGVLMLSMSVGLTLTWTVLALRRRYSESPGSAVLAAAIVGAVSSLLIVMAPSDSLFAGLLPMLALPVGAFTIRSERAWPRWVALASIAAVGLLLSLVVPRFLPPAERADFLTQERPPAHAEEVEGVTVRYDDIRVREVAVRLAHVLAAANLVSQEVYGISPQVDGLVIRGFEAGGLRGEFPHEIRGNFPSQRYTDLCLNSSFLNDPNTSIHFPDPVNAILHEYSHLYGIVPYMPWVIGGTSEEEGWATFSATRLSRKLHERFGPGLWNPSYNYAARADAITQSNLAGHPVYWSHPEEYVGFRLWYSLAQRDGEATLYRKRWALTRRDFHRWVQINDPGAARKMAEAFGFADFASLGSGKAIRYDQVYALPDLLATQLPLGQTADEVRMNYARNASRLVDPTVKVPPQRPFALDMGLSLVLLAVFGMIRSLRPLTFQGGTSVARQK